MLGLVEEVGREQAEVGRLVGQDQALGGGEDLHADDAVALHLELR